jgi:hypothetical protein
MPKEAAEMYKNCGNYKPAKDRLKALKIQAPNASAQRL